MELAKSSLLKITSCDGKLYITRYCKKLKTSTAETTVETAGNTNKMVNITAKFIMQIIDTKHHLFFILNCNGYNIWLAQILSRKLEEDNHSQIQNSFSGGIIQPIS